MLKLFNTLDGGNVINKSLTHIRDFNIKFKENVVITSPTVKLKIDDSFDLSECNYCFIEQFNRYYFIEDVQLITDNIYKLILECDVLESFKDDILNSYGEIERVTNVGDYIQFSGEMEVRKDIDIYDSTKGVTGEKYIVLSTIGG